MDKLADLNNYHDLGGLQNLKSKVRNEPGDKQALRQAAEHFESIFIGMMLKSMRDANAVFEQDNPMHSNTTRFFRDMYDQQLATDMATKGSMGLADLIVQQLSNDTDQYKAASVMRQDADLTRQNYAKQPIQFGNTSSGESDDASLKALFGEFNSAIDKSFAQAGLAKAKPEELTKTFENIPVVKAPEPKFDTPKDFIAGMWDYAKQAASKLGVNPAVMIAQSALETGWGKHIIKNKQGDSSFNLFNIKAHRDWTGEQAAQSTLEFEDGVAVRKVEPFRVYNNFREAFDDFVNFLKSNNRYQDALKNTSDPEQFLQKLQEAGYATDPNYADKILNILSSDKFKSVVSQVEKPTNNDIGA